MSLDLGSNDEKIESKEMASLDLDSGDEKIESKCSKLKCIHAQRVTPKKK